MDMTKDNTGEFLDLPKLADDVVFLLSSMQRGSEVSETDIEKAIGLCGHLGLLLQYLRAPKAEQQGALLPVGAVGSDCEVLRASVIDVNEAYRKTEEAEKLIGDLATDRSSHTPAEIERTKEHLVRITMPIWQSRTCEFQRRKMKRSLVVRA